MRPKPGILLWSLFLTWLPVTLIGQVTCTGTFGDNIFLEGDFGSGVENIVPHVTGIAPGYTYTTSTPPGDGFFTITNDMGRWSNNYETWVNVGDNSNDPRGYMMVVNASYSPGIFYEQTIENLCPNTTFEFSADILNVVRPDVTGHSLPDLEFLINDSVRYSTGEIPQDAKWYKHGFTFSLEPGQSSLKLTLVNKAPGGTGNDLALDNITFRPCGPDPDLGLTDEVVYCQSEVETGMISTEIDTNTFSVQWQTRPSPDAEWQDIGAVNTLDLIQDLKDPGTFYYRYKLSSSAENLNNPFCVSYSEVVSATVEPRLYEQWDTICMGNIRGFDGQILTAPGDYQAMYTSVQGCDSIVTLHLAMVDKVPLAFDLMHGDPLCHQSADGWVEVDNVQGGYPPYEYVLDSEYNASGRFDGLQSGLKTVLVRDHFGCQFSQSRELVDPPIFELASIRDTQLVLGEPLTIRIEGSESISSLTSTPDILSDCAPCQIVTFIPLGSTEVVITAANERGCTYEESFFIEVDDQNLPIAFPNAFTPNGDGVNDQFSVVAPPHLVTRILEVRILDRWGNEIYSAFDQMGGGNVALWDGSDNDLQAEPGLYAFVCEVELINGETKVFSGEVLVTGL